MTTPIFNEDCEDLAQDINSLQIAGKTIFITGSTGLLGKILAHSFIFANKKYGLNNKIILHARNAQKFQDIYSGELENISYIIGDIKDGMFLNEKVDYIIHLASMTASKAMVEQPIEVIDTTINGTLNILRFAKDHNAEKVVFTSTMEVFGETNGNFSKEDDIGKLSLTDVRSSYPESKRMAENICSSFASEYGMNISIARLTQTFGAGVDLNDKRIFSIIAKAVAEKRDVELASKGELVRDYCYSTDALSAVLYILKYGKSGNAYNVANPKTNTSVIEMAKMVADAYGQGQSNVVIKIPENVNKMGFSKPSVTRLSVEKLMSLGWRPKYGLLEMYGRLLQYYREINAEYDHEKRIRTE